MDEKRFIASSYTVYEKLIYSLNEKVIIKFVTSVVEVMDDCRIRNENGFHLFPEKKSFIFFY